MRTTQYIGLTEAAKSFCSEYLSYSRYNMTVGMFDEPIMGSEYEIFSRNGYKLMAKEVVQSEPWSSGPMIFTHLQLSLVGSDNKMDLGTIFSWTYDPNCVVEVDSLLGTQSLFTE